MKKQIIKELEKIAKKHGSDELAQVIETIYCSGQVSTQDDPLPIGQCPTGKIWNPILQKCVDDLG